MFNVTLSGLWARKRRLIGTSLAVVLGVAFLAATLVLGDTMRAGFAQAFTEANAGIDVVVRSTDTIGSGDSQVRDAIDASLVDEIAAVPGVRAAVPSIEGVATIVGADGERIGGDGPPDHRHQLDRRPDCSTRSASPRAAPRRRPGEVVIDRGAATAGDLARRRPHHRPDAQADRRSRSSASPRSATTTASARPPTRRSRWPRRARCSPRGPTPSRRSSSPPTTASAPRRCATRSPSCCRRASRR